MELINSEETIKSDINYSQILIEDGIADTSFKTIDPFCLCMACNSSVGSYLLSCLHPICFKCLPVIMKEDNSFLCQICCESSVEVMENMLATPPETPLEECAWCFKLSGITPYSFRCLQCRSVLCLDCLATHRTVPANKAHRVIQVRINKCHCSRHPSRPLDWFCEECDEFICELCQQEEGSPGTGSKGHQQHTVQWGRDWAGQVVGGRWCSGRLAALRRSHTALGEEVERLEAGGDRLEESYRVSQESLKQTFDRAFTMLTDYRDLTTRQLSQDHEKLQQVLIERRRIVKKASKETDALLGFMDSVCPASLNPLNVHRAVKLFLSRCTSVSLSVQLSDPLPTGLQWESRLAATPLQSGFIQSIGRVRVVSGGGGGGGVSSSSNVAAAPSHPPLSVQDKQGDSAGQNVGSGGGCTSTAAIGSSKKLVVVTSPPPAASKSRRRSSGSNESPMESESSNFGYSDCQSSNSSSSFPIPQKKARSSSERNKRAKSSKTRRKQRTAVIRRPSEDTDAAEDEAEDAYCETLLAPNHSPDDQHQDYCRVCFDGGDLVCCATCERVFHQHCHLPPLVGIPQDDWTCIMCCPVGRLSRDLEAKGGSGRCQQPAGHEDQEDVICAAEAMAANRLLMHLFDAPESLPFLYPVPKDTRSRSKGLYSKVIQHPMDLSTVKDRLNDKFYSNLNSFVKDIELIFSNCYQFNSTSSAICGHARKMSASFQALLLQIVQRK